MNTFLCLLSKRPGMGLIVGLYGMCMFNFIRNCQTVFQNDCSFLHSLQQLQSSSCSIYSPAFVGLCLLFVVAILTDSNGILGFYFILNFMELFAICVSSLGKCLSQLLAQFFMGLFMFLLLSFESYLYILDTSPLSDMWFMNIFSQSFHFLSFFFWPHHVACGTSLTRDRTCAPCSGSRES